MTSAHQPTTAPRGTNAYPDRPRVGVGVVVRRGDRVLLVRRAKPPQQGHWSLPGGSQELGETLFQTAEREVREETGITCHAVSVLTAVDAIHRDAEGRVQWHYTIIDVAAAWLSGEPVPADDVDAARWATAQEVEALVQWPKTRAVIQMVLAASPG